jgi:hypothetical protein
MLIILSVQLFLVTRTLFSFDHIEFTNLLFLAVFLGTLNSQLTIRKYSSAGQLLTSATAARAKPAMGATLTQTFNFFIVWQ